MSSYFHEFKSNIKDILPPKEFNYPFYYTPHKLALLASKQLQDELEKSNMPHNFGLDTKSKLPIIGKMFGVLVVKKKCGKIGYLSAYSGKLYNDIAPKGFCPFILSKDKLIQITEEQKELVYELGEKIEILENCAEFIELDKSYKAAITLQNAQIKACNEKMLINKSQRKELRLKNDKALNQKLSAQSMHDKFYQKHLIEHFKEKSEIELLKVQGYYSQIRELKDQRRKISQSLQSKIFSSYVLTNAKAQQKTLTSLFIKTNPPAGSGDCAAPKLLEQAYKDGLTPLTMAEFWWGAPHKGSVKKHKNFYPACSSKCRPILSFMLQGLSVAIDPINNNDTTELEVQTIFEDEHLIIINKPSGLLSVRGRILKDSIEQRFEKYKTDPNPPLIVHRLDQDTSGIMILTKTKLANKKIQIQFIDRTISKKYLAILDGNIKSGEGEINLPLRGDPDNRPCQLVCYEYGKKAKTKYKVIKEQNNKTLIEFSPITGRTHQLRVHSAHNKGLGVAILGDDMYGVKENRLYLHAYSISFNHPLTNEPMNFTSPPNQWPINP